ncbi:unnamed protein product [Didymodactylos carnosus]|uniref:Methyltransferase type 11 domain-containing protein n=1 Tax=Didymodactylos carnosus TaxID=1234261 RepID=A0A8S2E541_9BILA|nr:unnamed protein product [Didymodactylos carnosus]CAF3834966.1 unnamed protein product [Didymodactylos carnosus]
MVQQPPYKIQKEDLLREDETSDNNFYSTPRFVHHIDDRARFILSRFYKHMIVQQQETQTIDICSSWTSHLPQDWIGKVHGLGMNELELKHNPSLNNGYTVQDLNCDPKLNYSSDTFDAVICSMSIDYLIQPLEVFKEISRILKSGGIFITSFSNRCFSTKVIGRWLYMSEIDRVYWVGNYFLSSSDFNHQTLCAYSIFDNIKQQDNFFDPMYVVFGYKK